MRRILVYGMAAFYVFAGLNHFIMPDFYLGLIPEYLVFPKAINGLAGIAEISLGLALTMPSLRKYASWGIIIMLIAFIPSHIYFIEIGSCVGEGLCVPPWVSWIRLLVIHPLLILWAFTVGGIKQF